MEARSMDDMLERHKFLAAASRHEQSQAEEDNDMSRLEILYNSDGRAADVNMDYKTARKALNANHTETDQGMKDVIPILKPGLEWVSDGFGEGQVLDGDVVRDIGMADMKVHKHKGYWKVAVYKFGAIKPQEVNFDPKTGFLKHDSNYQGAVWDSTMLIAAWWLRQAFEDYAHLWKQTSRNPDITQADWEPEGKKPKPSIDKGFSKPKGRPPKSLEKNGPAPSEETPADKNNGRRGIKSSKPAAYQLVQFKANVGPRLMVEYEVESWRVNQIHDAIHDDLLLNRELKRRLIMEGELGTVDEELVNVEDRIKRLLAQMPAPSQRAAAEEMPYDAYKNAVKGLLGKGGGNARDAILIATEGTVTPLDADFFEKFLPRTSSYHDTDRYSLVRDLSTKTHALHITTRRVTVGCDQFNKPIKRGMPYYMLIEREA